MNIIKKQIVTALIVFIFLISGCKSISDISNSVSNMTGLTPTNTSPEAEQLNKKIKEFDKTVVQGALVGAATGALVGFVTGNNRKAIITGAVVGAASGAGYGYYVAGKKQEYADKESTLNAIRQDLDKSNSSLIAIVGTAEKVLMANEKKLAELRAQLARNQVEQEEYNEQLVQVRNDISVIGKAIKVVDTKYAQAVKNMESFEEQYGVENKKELQAMLLIYQKQKALLADVDSKLEALIDIEQTNS